MINNSQFKPISKRLVMAKIVVVTLMLITSSSFLALHIPPQKFVIFQWIGVTLPILIGCNLFVLIIAVYKRSWYSICPILAILTNFHYFPKILQHNSKQEEKIADIKFATFNVQEFKMLYNMSSMNYIAEYLSSTDVNTICLQEVPSDCTVDELKQVFPTMNYAILTGSTNGEHQLAVMSTFSIDSVKTVSFAERANCALFVNLNVKNQKVRVGTFHLQTTSWNQVKESFTGDNHSKRNWMTAMGIMSENFRIRGKQVDSLRNMIDTTAYPVLMCGDLNNTPISYSYKKIRGDLNDAFCDAGNGYSYTYRYFMKLFRIDFVFFSGKKFEAVNYRTGQVDFSDHLPVLVDLKVK